MSGAAPVPSGDEPAKPPAKNNNVGCIVLAAVMLLLFVSCLNVGDDDDEEFVPSDFDAERQCEDWVRERLKAPATAEFSGTTSTGGPAVWTITGSVDSENGFGALIRSRWTCNIELDGDTWRGGVEVIE